jgi:hypothetical protein
MSPLTSLAGAYATTSGGETRKPFCNAGWTLPGTLRFPDRPSVVMTLLDCSHDLIIQRASIADAGSTTKANNAKFKSFEFF